LQDLFLHRDRQGARAFILAAAERFQPQPVGPPIALVRVAADQPGPAHAFEERSHRVWIAAHQLRQLPLRDPFILEQGSHHRKLIRRDTQVGDAPAESLVQAVPSLAQQWRQTPASGRVDRQRAGNGN